MLEIDTRAFAARHKNGESLRANHKNDQTTDGMHLQMVQGKSRLRYDTLSESWWDNS